MWTARRALRLLQAGAAGDAWLLLKALGARAGGSNPLNSRFLDFAAVSATMASAVVEAGSAWVMLAAEVALARWEWLPKPPGQIDHDLSTGLGEFESEDGSDPEELEGSDDVAGSE